MNSSHANHAGRRNSASPAKGARRFSPGAQGKLFAKVENTLPGSISDSSMIRVIVSEALTNCGLSRVQVADAMTRLTGSTVTERQLNNFSAESRAEYRFPIELTRAFCVATGDDRLLTCCAEMAGLHVIDENGWKLLELGREYLRRQRAVEAIASFERSLEGVELG